MGEPCAMDMEPEAMREDVPTSGRGGGLVDAYLGDGREEGGGFQWGIGGGDTDVITSAA